MHKGTAAAAGTQNTQAQQYEAQIEAAIHASHLAIAYLETLRNNAVF
jgi:hypothetical protein